MASPAQVIFSLINNQTAANHIPHLQLFILYPEGSSATSFSVNIAQISPVPISVLRTPMRCSIRVKMVPTAAAVLRKVPILMDMKPMQPRLQAVDGSLNQAELRGQL